MPKYIRKFIYGTIKKKGQVMKKVLNIIVLFIIFYFCLSCQNSTLAMANNVKANTNEQSEYVNKQYEYLLDDVKSYRNYIQTERTEHRYFLEDLFTKTLWALGVIVTLGTAVFSYFLGESCKQTKEQVNSIIISSAKNIIKEANDEINSQINNLKNRVDEELSYKNAKMYIWDPNDEIKDVIDIFKNKGIKEIVHSKELKELDNSFCIAIFNFNPNTNLDKVITHFEKKKLDMPFLIYTLTKIDTSRLNKCKYYYSLANSKTTLIINTFSLLKMFC